MSSSSTRKRFNNISVSDGNFLVPLNSTRPPEILVLSARSPGDTCRVGQSNRSRLCKSCCLQTEWMSSNGKRQRQCFAECGSRRPIDIELKAKPSQPDGKLMILALKQLLKSPIEQPFRCHTSTTWAYYKKSNLTIASARAASHTYYSSLAGTNQVPKLRIESLELSWSPSDKRELVSLQFEPSSPVPDQHEQAVYTSETLVVVELCCYQTLANSSQTEPSVSTTLHLLALIDRQQLKERPQDAPTKQVPHPSQHHQSSATTTTKCPSTTLPIDTTGKPIPMASDTTELVPTTTLGSVLLQAPVPALDRTQHRFHLLTTEFELIKHQLRANGLLFLMLLSLALLILIYSFFCLCMKPASKPTIKGRCEKRKRKLSEKHQQEAPMRISKPFNLQMPAATQIRLEAMMGPRSQFPAQAGCGDGRERLVPSSSGGWRILGSIPHPAVLNRAKVAPRQQVRERPSFRVALKQHAANQLPELSRGTIRMVRNLRSAASSARSRLKQTRPYQSNLHAIPELEPEQARPKSSLPTLVHINSQAHRNQNQVTLVPAQELDSKQEHARNQLESVVYDALSNECSHFVEKFNALSPTTAIATLFAKPDKLNRSSLAPAPEFPDSKLAVQVSRSLILKQVKLLVNQQPGS